MNKHLKNRLEVIAKERESKIMAIYQEFAEKTILLLRDLLPPVFDEFPSLVSVSWEQSPQYNDEEYLYGLGSMDFEPEPDDWNERDAMQKAFSEVLEEYELEKLLKKTLGNVNITMTREGVEVTAMADQDYWFSRYG